MTPKSEALAFRVWAYAAPRGWDCTHKEVAEALDASPYTIGNISRWKGWSGRFRITDANRSSDRLEQTNSAGFVGSFDGGYGMDHRGSAATE